MRGRKHHVMQSLTGERIATRVRERENRERRRESEKERKNDVSILFK